MRARTPSRSTPRNRRHAATIAACGAAARSEAPAPTTDLILLGAGHAHVEVLRRFAARPITGARLTLITREPRSPYSGMLPGLIRGDVTDSDTHIDCAPLAAAAGARLRVVAATGIDLAARRLHVAGGPPATFDLLSIDVGGLPRRPADAGGIAVKPIGQFLGQFRSAEARHPPDGRIVVIGGGAGGVELALALARRHQGRVALVTEAAGILPGAPPRARDHARRALTAAAIAVFAGAAAIRHEGDALILAHGGTIAADVVLWATGVVAPEFLAASGLACDASGCVRVGATLRCESHDFVFAAGDCAALADTPRPKAGVWAVRAGAPLTKNLRRAVAGRPLRPWHPQRDALVILGLGDGRAVAWRGDRFLFAGRLASRWKDWIDRRWMRRYQHLRPAASPPAM